jgi:hypothetical protein
VLLMFDRIDEWMLGSLREYDGKKLQNVAKGELPLDEADTLKQDEATEAAGPLLAKLKALLGDRVSDVRVSARLTDSRHARAGRPIWPALRPPAARGRQSRLTANRRWRSTRSTLLGGRGNRRGEGEGPGDTAADRPRSPRRAIADPAAFCSA